MKGGVAMFISTLLRAKASDTPLPGDLIVAIGHTVAVIGFFPFIVLIMALSANACFPADGLRCLFLFLVNGFSTE